MEKDFIIKYRIRIEEVKMTKEELQVYEHIDTKEQIHSLYNIPEDQRKNWKNRWIPTGKLEETNTKVFEQMFDEDKIDVSDVATFVNDF